MKVLFAAAEASPLVKVGGLADVAGSLPRELRRLGLDVRMALPRYASLQADGVEAGRFGVEVAGSREEVILRESSLDEVPLYLVENGRYFGRPAVYGEADDLERFLLFSKAVLEVPRATSWQPDVLHCHDWHLGMAAVLLKFRRRAEGSALSAMASVLTIHNLAYQGWFDDAFAARASLHPYLPPQGDPMRPRTYNLLGLALYHADVISTVSPTYAREILTPEYGEGLEEVLKLKGVHGILNGIDYQEFDPASDPHLPARYEASTLEVRQENKAELQRRAGLPARPGVPLLGMVGRLAAQKGVDLVAQALPSLLKERDVQFLWLGSGEEKFRLPVAQAIAAFPDKARLIFGFDLALAPLIYAGCDLFLMPSRHEPCGLGQLIALRYGAIPVVRATGGLADTIQDCSADLAEGNGFVFRGYNVPEFLEALGRALATYEHKAAWRRLQVRAMGADFSWKTSAAQYLGIYRRALASLSRGHG